MWSLLTKFGTYAAQATNVLGSLSSVRDIIRGTTRTVTTAARPVVSAATSAATTAAREVVRNPLRTIADLASLTYIATTINNESCLDTDNFMIYLAQRVQRQPSFKPTFDRIQVTVDRGARYTFCQTKATASVPMVDGTNRIIEVTL